MAYNVLHMGSDKRIPCSTETFEQAKALKDERGQTWDQFVVDATEDSEPYASVTVDSDDLMDSLRDELDELLTINVDVDLPNESDLSQDDVQTIVKSEIERTVHERARQL